MDLISGTTSSEKQHEKSVLSRISSLTKGVSSMSAERTHSPVIPVADSATSSSEEYIIDMSNMDKEEQKHIKRSFSAPINFSSRLEHMDSVGLDQMILTSPHPFPTNGVTLDNAVQTNNAIEGEGTHASEEKAVCRICLVELGESGETLKMDCSCKGELALAHQECAVEWFSIKGNKTCDVCKQDVQNLPTALLKKHSSQTTRRLRQDSSQPGEVAQYRVWQDVPVLVLVSMLAYFCLLEQLLVTGMGTHALALALPFSSVLDLLSSMIASMVDISVDESSRGVDIPGTLEESSIAGEEFRRTQKICLKKMKVTDSVSIMSQPASGIKRKKCKKPSSPHQALPHIL